MPLSLFLLKGDFAVCRLKQDAPQPDWGQQGQFYALVRTPDELSIVCAERFVPPGVPCERGWSCLGVAGPLDFSLVGILASLSASLAQAGVSLFAVSTFDTDYLLVKTRDLEKALAALSAAGHRITRPY